MSEKSYEDRLTGLEAEAQLAAELIERQGRKIALLEKALRDREKGSEGEAPDPYQFTTEELFKQLSPKDRDMYWSDMIEAAKKLETRPTNKIGGVHVEFLNEECGIFFGLPELGKRPYGTLSAAYFAAWELARDAYIPNVMDRKAMTDFVTAHRTLVEDNPDYSLGYASSLELAARFLRIVSRRNGFATVLTESAATPEHWPCRELALDAVKFVLNYYSDLATRGMVALCD